MGTKWQRRLNEVLQEVGMELVLKELADAAARRELAAEGPEERAAAGEVSGTLLGAAKRLHPYE